MHTHAPSASPSSSRPARGASSRQTSTAEAFPHVSEDPETRSTPSTSAGASASMSSGCKSGTTCILSGCMTTAKPRRASWLGDADVARAFHLWEGVSPPPVVFAAFPRAARYRAKRSRRQMSLGCNARGSRRAATLGEGSATGAITLSRRGCGFDGALGAVGVPFYVDLLLVPRTTARNRTRRPFLGATEAAIGVSRARARWRASLRADFARSSARESRLAPRDGARPRSPSRRAPRFDSSRVPAIPRSRLFQNRRPRARPAGTTRFSSSPLSSPSPPSFLPSDSHLACHPTALSTAPNLDADSSRRGLAVTTQAGFAGAVGRFTPSPSCTSSWASPSSATTSSHHRSSSSARD